MKTKKLILTVTNTCEVIERFGKYKLMKISDGISNTWMFYNPFNVAINTDMPPEKLLT